MNYDHSTVVCLPNSAAPIEPESRADTSLRSPSGHRRRVFRKLMSLCRKSLGSQEMGTLKTSLDTVRGEVESMAKQHQSIAGQMKTELEEPLAAFAGGMKRGARSSRIRLRSSSRPRYSRPSW